MMIKLKTLFLFLGDVAMLYAALFLMLVARYGGSFHAQISSHLAPFSIVFAFWLLIFYISGLYDLRHLRNTLEFVKNLNWTIAVSATATVFFFYLVPFFGITPKRNLFIFLAIFAIIEVLWRRRFNAAMSSAEAPNKIVLVDGESARGIDEILIKDPKWLAQFGYKIVGRAQAEDVFADPGKLDERVRKGGANLVIVPRRAKNNPELARALYRLMTEGVEIRDLPNFYELVARKVPLADLEETWFLENLAEQKKFYDPLKRSAELLFGFVLAIVLSPIMIAAVVIIKLSSPGPAIYRQTRTGKNGGAFTLYKFRTMRADAERGGARWAEQGDRRAFPFGRLLRRTHLDELPQLWNIIKGDLSFVGPRPERPEFVEKLKKEIPYYEARLLIKPGVTGWAQIHHRADLSEEDVMEKLQYDLYYLKNRSPVLDLLIILKTAKTVFVSPK